MVDTENMHISAKDFRFSYTHMLLTLVLFSASFTSFENALSVTLAFLLIINVTSFSNEYFLIQYLRKNIEKNSNKIYANFIAAQVLLTLVMFIGYKFIILS